MRILSGYLLRTVIAATAIVLLALLALAGFIEFVGQLDDTGTGGYTVAGAVLYAALRLPLLSVEMLPMAALLGALLGLGGLAAHSELVAMRAAGISARRLSVAVAVSGVVLAVAGSALGEFIAPPLDQFARKYRNSARNETDLVGQRSTWVRDGNTIFNVERISSELEFGGVFIFEVGPKLELLSVGHADRAGLDADDRWVLENFEETRFTSERVAGAVQPRAVQDHNVNAELLGIAALKPSSLSLRGLVDYLRYLKVNRLDAAAYQTEFWNRIANSFSIVLMPMLAIGFVFGSLRSAGAGARLLVGVLIGLAYFLVSRTLANSGQVFNLDPFVVAWAPAAALAVITATAVSRVR